MFSRRKEGGEGEKQHPFSSDKEALKAALARTREESLAFLDTVESYKNSREKLKQTPKKTKDGIETQKRIWEARKKMTQESILLARLNRFTPNIYGSELLLDIIKILYDWLKEHAHDSATQKEHIENVRRTLENVKLFWKEKTGRTLIIDDSGIFEEEIDD